VVKYLVEEAGADVRCAGPDGMTPLMMAAGEGHVDIVKYMRGRQDIDIDTKNAVGNRALDIACGQGHLKMAKLLVAAGARVEAEAGETGPLVSAALGGSLQLVKYLVEEVGADVRWVDSDGKTALMWAAAKGHVDVVEYLRGRQDVDIHAQTPEGHTALDGACGNGHLAVVKLLVAAGARVNPQASDEWWPLLSAAIGGSLQVVKYLVEEAGADVRCVGPDGRTALMMAHVDVAEYLLRVTLQREYEVNVAPLLSVPVYNRLM
jgi:ankyrin repeat protein